MTPVESSFFKTRDSSDATVRIRYETIGRSFELQAERTPHNIAIQLGSDSITYLELDMRANQIARLLLTYGAGPEQLVAVCFERSLEMIVSMLAVLKAGAGYLPIDPSYPVDRINLILEDAKPSAILTQKALAGSLPQTDVVLVCLDQERETISREDTSRLPGFASSDNLAYVIYTSGSTGRPKGVMVTHHNVGRLLKSTAPWFDFQPTDVWTLFHSASFDFSVWEIWGCLLTGGRLVCVPYWITRSPRDFYSLLASERVTVLNQTPAAFYQIIQLEESGIAEQLTLRYVIFGGEALNFANLRPWFARHGDRQPQLINMYGITETTVHVTYRPVTSRDALTETRSLIGKPIPDLEIYLLDSELQPVPVGVIGEMYIGGAGVARGYLNRPHLTLERFVEDPFAGRPGDLMYKSGDLARSTDDGDLEFLGRADTQVKIRGFRIELGEIEAALLDHAGVQQAVVMARNDGPGEPKLVAYFSEKSGQSPTAHQLRDFLKMRLPEHMIPYAYVGLPALPLTLNGKIDSNLLLPPEHAAVSEEFVATFTPLQREIADAWCKALGLQRVGLGENFFDVGGDSLLLAGLHIQLQNSLKIEFPITDLFEFSTVRSLADRLTSKSSEPASFDGAQQRAQRQRGAFSRKRALHVRDVS